MPDLEEIIQHGLTGMKSVNADKGVDEVKKTAEHIRVIDETVNTADKLAGGPGMREEIKRKEDQLQKLTEENQKLLDQLHKADIATIKTELGAKIDQLTESVNKGATRQKISEEIEEVKRTATALGLGTTKMSELNDMMSFIDKLRPDKGLAEQVKEARELLKNLEPEKADATTELPASIALQLKKMDHDLQITLQNMEDARQERAQKFELTLLEFKDNRELKKAEIDAKISVEKERNELLSGLISKFGGAVARATSEAGQEMTAGKVASQVIEAGVGEFGEIPCHCGGTVAIARDATKAICPDCSTTYEIQRIAKEPGIAEIEPESPD